MWENPLRRTRDKVYLPAGQIDDAFHPPIPSDFWEQVGKGRTLRVGIKDRAARPTSSFELQFFIRSDQQPCAEHKTIKNNLNSKYRKMKCPFLYINLLKT